MRGSPTRTHLVDTGTRLFAERGYGGTGIQDILAAAEVPKGSFYHHFKSKEALTVALVDRIFSGMEDNFFSDDFSETVDEFKSTLRKTMDIPKEHAAFIRVFFEVFGPSFASKDFVKKVAGFFERLGDHYADHIKQLQQNGEVSEEIDPKTTGRALSAMVDGIILHKGLFAISTAKHRKLIEASLEVMTLR